MVVHRVFRHTPYPSIRSRFLLIANMSSPSSIFPLFEQPPSSHLPCNLVSRVLSPLGNYLRVLYLFTRSDLNTTFLPVVCPSPLSSLSCNLTEIMCRPFLLTFQPPTQAHIVCYVLSHGRGCTFSNATSQIKVWTSGRMRQISHGGPSLRVSYLLTVHAPCVGFSSLHVFSSLCAWKHIGKAFLLR